MTERKQEHVLCSLLSSSLLFSLLRLSFLLSIPFSSAAAPLLFSQVCICALASTAVRSRGRESHTGACGSASGAFGLQPVSLVAVYWVSVGAADGGECPNSGGGRRSPSRLREMVRGGR